MKLQQTIFCLLLATCCLLGSCDYSNQPPVESTDQTTEKPTAESTIESTQPTDTSEPNLTIDPSEFVVQPTVVDSVEVLDSAGNTFTATNGMTENELMDLYKISINSYLEYVIETSTYYVFLTTPGGEPVLGIGRGEYQAIMECYLIFPVTDYMPTEGELNRLVYGMSVLDIVKKVGIPTEICLVEGNFPFISYLTDSGKWYQISMFRHVLSDIVWYTTDDESDGYHTILPSIPLIYDLPKLRVTFD